MTKTQGIVRTKFGQVSGLPLAGKYEGITEFRGIPYAAPPVGALRFRAPEDPAAWEGVKVCDAYAPMAMQDRQSGLGFEPYSSDFYWEGYPTCSEDCLYLNIATPADLAADASQAGKKYPVFIWFHGGGLADGYSFEPVFDPSELARKGVVVVSVGQRLNLFGYIALPQLTAEQDGKSGNYGLMDEVKALDWVCDNIAAFGGDPDNITVGGQSGGTAKSGALATSPKARGRVKRVINQSNLFWLRGYMDRAEMEEQSRTYLASVGIDPDASLEELRQLDARAFLGPKGSIGRFRGAMVWDGDYVAHPEQTRNFEEYGAGLDVLAGNNLGEAALRGNGLFDPLPFTEVDEFYAFMKEYLGDLYEKYDFERAFSVDRENLDVRSRQLASYGMGGFGGLMVNRHFGAYRKAKGASGKTFIYLFSHLTPWRPEDIGTRRDPYRLLSWHSSELWYTFASLREGVPPARPWQPLDFELADRISGYWANFIRTGDPNGEGLPVWPKSDAGYGWMSLGDTLEGHEGLEGDLEKMILEKTLENPSIPRV